MNTQELKLPARSVRSSNSGDMRSLLHRHLASCRAETGRIHRLYCWSEAIYDVIAPRLVTTAVVLVAVALVIEHLV